MQNAHTTHISPRFIVIVRTAQVTSTISDSFSDDARRKLVSALSIFTLNKD